MISRRSLLGAAAGAMVSPLILSERFGKEVKLPVLMGESREVIAASPNGEGSWFTNDHCFIEDRKGRMHWFGINNPFPPEGKELYRYHPYIGHCSTDDPLGNWVRHEFALDESEGTEYLGAPFVVYIKERDRYAMVLETRLEDTRRLEVCWSDDLETWERTWVPILPDDLWISTRDPQIIQRPDGSYWILVVSFGAKGAKQSQIIRIMTRDFSTFSGPEIVMGINDCDWATLMESPFLLEHDDLWYLFFTYAHRRYTETPVVVSDNPERFSFKNGCVTTLFGHAAEIFTYRGRQYISSCGPEDKSVINRHGITLSRLGWAAVSGS